MNSAGPPLVGVILAGGASSRMGRDKAAVVMEGETQAERLLELLSSVCAAAVLSVRPGQARGTPYERYPLLEDAYPPHGPMAGLLTAAAAFPGKAILAVAVDTLGLTRRKLSLLIGRRRADRAATVPYRETDDVFEPLFAIYEPGAFPALLAAAGNGEFGIQAVLKRLDVFRLPADEIGGLGSFNTEEELQGRKKGWR